MEYFELKYGKVEGFNYKIRTPINSLVLDIGVNDVDFMVASGGKKFPLYTVWYNMLYRCTPEYGLKWPSYAGCTVDQSFKNLSKFIEWANNSGYIPGYHLDKDILVRNNKVYGANTCMFVPAEVNTCITSSTRARGELPLGVYLDGSRYKAQITTSGSSRRSLGRFATIEEAHSAWQSEKLTHLKFLQSKYPNINISSIIQRLELDINKHEITECI